jgi:hypothetical protein
VRWTLQLLAGRLVALTRLDSLSHEAVRLVLKKNNLKPWQRQKWCIPTVVISVLTEQCLDRRMGSQAIVANEISAWESERIAARATIA